MRPQKVQDEEIFAGLANVFRSKGYEGASLTELSEATGLKKASLYHRFPNGKEEMAKAVLSVNGQWADENIFKVLLNEQQPAEKRLKEALSKIRTLYNGGKDACIFRALSMEAGLVLFNHQVSEGMKKWISAFEAIGVALGQSPEVAKENGTQALIDIQGSLVVARGLGDFRVFENALKNIEHRYHA